MLDNRKKQLLEKVSYLIWNVINEARVQRTIPKNIWANVSSMLSKGHRPDMGANAGVKRTWTIDYLTQMYVVALILLNQECPTTTAELKASKCFPKWAKGIIVLGGTVCEVIRLYNENTGKEVKCLDGSCTNVPQIQHDVFAPVEDAPVIEVDDKEIQDPLMVEPEIAEEIEDEVNNTSALNDNHGYYVQVVLHDKPELELNNITSGWTHSIINEEVIPHSEFRNIDDVVNYFLDEYNTPKMKMKLRSGRVKTMYSIYIIDNYTLEKRRIDIFREETPRITDATLIEWTKLEKKAGTYNERVMDNESRIYIIKYLDFDGDISSVWYTAENETDARKKFKNDYPNCSVIVIMRRKNK